MIIDLIEGAKTPKVELTISIDGVAIQEPKTKRICHQFPLHRISYCADDKSEKKFFSFIAKESDSEKHNCFVFISDKLAEEITLTIGQAFDLAYRKFLESSGRDLEMKRQLMVLQKRVRELELENSELRAKISASEANATKPKHNSTEDNLNNCVPELVPVMNGSSTANSEKKAEPQMSRLTPIQPPPSALPRTLNRTFSANRSVNLLDIDVTTEIKPTVGRKLENLNFDEMDEEFNPRASDSINCDLLSSDDNQKNGHSTNGFPKDMFGTEPFNCNKQNKDPFGMGQFGAHELETAIGQIDKKLAEMRVNEALIVILTPRLTTVADKHVDQT